MRRLVRLFGQWPPQHAYKRDEGSYNVFREHGLLAIDGSMHAGTKNLFFGPPGNLGMYVYGDHAHAVFQGTAKSVHGRARALARPHSASDDTG